MDLPLIQFQKLVWETASTVLLCLMRIENQFAKDLVLNTLQT